MIEITKLGAARRQLRAAIRMLFTGADPVAVHTLVGAASVLAADLANHHHPDMQWERLTQKANDLTPKQYYDLARATQNFLKHADQDVDEIHRFHPKETDTLAFVACRNLSNFGELSVEESTFELWYIACTFPDDDEVFARAARFFGDLRACDRAAQLAKGREVLGALLAR